MQEIKLKAQKREITGKKVKKLRKEGLVPANIYGKKTKSLAVSLIRDEFSKVYNQAGETGVVKLTVEGEKEERPILIQNIHLNPVSEEMLHVDLRQIILTEKVTAKIPVEVVGKAPVAEEKLGILIQTVSEIEVKALPMDLPEKFVADVSKLMKVGDEVFLKDLDIGSSVEVKADKDLVIAKIEPLAAEEVVTPPPVAEGEVTGEVPAEGEEKTEKESTPAEEKTQPPQEKQE